MSAPFSPVVAFGLRAVAMAMKAKTNQLGRGEPIELVEFCAVLAPDDAPAMEAVRDFVALAAVDPALAGMRLHEFIIGWRAGELRRDMTAVDRTMRTQLPEQFEWANRKDCGHG